MRIRIPALYTESVVPKQARTVRDLHFGDWFEVEIQEVSDFEAPVAIEWRIERHDRDYSAIDNIVQLRYFAGHFFEVQPITEAYKPNIPLTAEEMVEMTSSGSYSSNPLLGSNDDGRSVVDSPELYTSFKPDEYRAVYSTGKADKLKELQERASNIIIVDGLVWTKTHEPVLKIEQETSFHSTIDFSIRIKNSKHIQTEDIRDVFRLDRMDDAIAFGKELCEGNEFSIRQDPQILHSEALSFKDDRPALLSCLEYYITNSKNDVLDESKEYVIAWYDLRTAFEAIAEDTSDVTLDLIVEDAKNVLAEKKELGIYEGWLKATIGRWNSRPIEITHKMDFDAL